MPKIIVNSTPIIVLCGIGRLDVLQRLYGEIKVPKDMAVFINNHNLKEEVRRNAMLLYPYIKDLTISHGQAAEIIGISRLDFLISYIMRWGKQMGLKILYKQLVEIYILITPVTQPII